MENKPLNGWNNYLDRSSGPGSMNFFDRNFPTPLDEQFKEFLQKALDKMDEDNFNKLPYSTQLQIKLERIRKQINDRIIK